MRNADFNWQLIVALSWINRNAFKLVCLLGILAVVVLAMLGAR